jgi:lysophospholipid acyltransferase (LPLAT)-like uncharacterized protein
MKKKILLFLVTTFFRILKSTYRFKIHGKRRHPHLMAFWHKDMIGCFCANTNTNHIMLISQSKDGDFATQFIANFGHEAIRGSSSKGGKAAMQMLIETLQLRARDCALTVDGPRGPALEPKLGIFEISRQTQIPITPIRVVCESKHVFKKAWDKFELPYPFSKIHVYYGEAIVVPTSTDKENYPAMAIKLKNAMLAEGQN